MSVFYNICSIISEKMVLNLIKYTVTINVVVVVLK